MKYLMLLTLSLLLSLPTQALACGFCDGDALAGTYDYKLSKEIKKRGLLLIGFRLRCLDEVEPIIKKLNSFPGVMENSVRINCDVGVISMGIDPSQTQQTDILENFNNSSNLKTKLEDQNLGLKSGEKNE